MIQQIPLETVHEVDEVFNRVDIETVLDCYEVEACMDTPSR